MCCIIQSYRFRWYSATYVNNLLYSNPVTTSYTFLTSHTKNRPHNSDSPSLTLSADGDGHRPGSVPIPAS